MMISPEQYIDGLEWRYACKKFDPEARLEQPTWHALAESLRLSPSSLGLQLWKFVVVTNRELKPAGGFLEPVPGGGLFPLRGAVLPARRHQAGCGSLPGPD